MEFTNPIYFIQLGVAEEEMWLGTEEAARLGAEEVASRLRVDLRSGLWWREAELRRQLAGHNEFCVKEDDPIWKKYIEQGFRRYYDEASSVVQTQAEADFLETFSQTEVSLSLSMNH